jgi:hypothetical protein
MIIKQDKDFVSQKLVKDIGFLFPCRKSEGRNIKAMPEKICGSMKTLMKLL